MTYYPDMESNTIDDKLDVLIRMMDGLSIVYTASIHSALMPDTHHWTPNPRGKYIRVWRQNWSMPYNCDECSAKIRKAVSLEDFEAIGECNHEKIAKEGQRFVDFFVEKATGDVWKADGWKKPALNFVRGNINTPEGRRAITIGKMNETGYYYPAF